MAQRFSRGVLAAALSAVLVATGILADVAGLGIAVLTKRTVAALASNEAFRSYRPTTTPSAEPIGTPTADPVPSATETATVGPGPTTTRPNSNSNPIPKPDAEPVPPSSSVRSAWP